MAIAPPRLTRATPHQHLDDRGIDHAGHKDPVGAGLQVSHCPRECFAESARPIARRPQVDIAADVAPYDWPKVAALLADRAVPGVESVIDGVYRRTISLDGAPGVLEISAGAQDHLTLRMHLPYWERLIHIVERRSAPGQ